MNDPRSVTVLERIPMVHVLADEIAFRVVCHETVIRGVIGFDGSIISKIRRETGTKIHCRISENGLDHSIIFIIGSTVIDRCILLTDRVRDFSGGKQEDLVTYKVSAAQAALIRVLERSWMLMAGKDGEAFCGILADQTQIGALLGKEGENVEWMRRETGAIIRVLPQSTSNTNNDVLIQITGGVLPVKKAVVIVSGCLQDCPPLNGYPPPLCSKAYDSSTDVEDLYSNFFPNLGSLLPPLSSDNAFEAASSRHLSKDIKRQIVFRLICTNLASGGIIGKKGTIIKALKNETSAAIKIRASLKHDEHVVTISAIENLVSQYSPAQNALILVFARTVEFGIENGLMPRFHNGTTVKARLLVPSQFANGFNANNKELIATGVELHVSVGEQIMDCNSNNESILEIKGNFKQVQQALLHITSELRDNLLPKELLVKVRARDSSNTYEVAGPNHISNPQPSQNATRGDSLSISDGEQDLNMVKTDCLMHTDVFKDADELKGGTTCLASLKKNDLTQGMKQLQLINNLERRKGISLKNITLELAIERDALVTLYGRDGTCLDNLQQITGTKVDVQEDSTRSEIKVVTSGSPEKTCEAVSWIVSILADQNVK